jgi:hypothetical protein
LYYEKLTQNLEKYLLESSPRIPFATQKFCTVLSSVRQKSTHPNANKLPVFLISVAETEPHNFFGLEPAPRHFSFLELQQNDAAVL